MKARMHFISKRGGFFTDIIVKMMPHLRNLDEEDVDVVFVVAHQTVEELAEKLGEGVELIEPEPYEVKQVVNVIELEGGDHFLCRYCGSLQDLETDNCKRCGGPLFGSQVVTRIDREVER